MPKERRLTARRTSAGPPPKKLHESGGSLPDAALQRRFAELYEALSSHVYRAAWFLSGNSAEAEDLSHDAFVRIFESLVQGRIPRAPRSWALKILLNLWKDRLRSRGRLSDARSALARMSRGAPPGPAAQSPWSHLTRVPPQQRACLVLRYSMDMSVREISEVLGVPFGTVCWRLSRGRATLARALAGKGGEEGGGEARRRGR